MGTDGTAPILWARTMVTDPSVPAFPLKADQVAKLFILTPVSGGGIVVGRD